MLSGSDAINNAVKQSHMVVCHFSVQRANAPEPTDTRFVATEGTYTQDRTSNYGSRVSLVIPQEGMWDADSGLPTIMPYGDRIKLWRGIIAPDGMAWTAQLGVFRVDSVAFNRPSSTFRVEASGLMSQVDDSLFTAPRLVRNDDDKEAVLRNLVDEALVMWGPGARANRAPDETNSLGAIYNQSRMDAVSDLALALGVDAKFNNNGTLVLVPTPTAADPVVWELYAGEEGTVIDYGTQFDRGDSYNGVVAEGRSPYGRPVRELVTNNNPDDPMRWGGPFGYVPTYYTSDVLRTREDCRLAAEARLNDGRGRARQVSITCVAHSGLESGDLIRLRTVTDQEVLVILDQVDMPLGPGQMKLSGRVVQGWEYTNGE